MRTCFICDACLCSTKIEKVVRELFDLRPYAIEQRLKLRQPIYSDSAAYGHMGRTPEVKMVSFRDGNGTEKTIEVETFTWEKLDYVNSLRERFSIGARAVGAAK